MYISGAELTKKLDNESINRYGFSEIVLMENAAGAAVNRLYEIENDCGEIFDRIIFVCGTGNNGGDGYVMARKLHLEGRTVSIVAVGNQEKFSKSAYENFRIAKNIGIDIVSISSYKDLARLDGIDFRKTDLVVDCIFGAGLNRNISSYFEDVILCIKEKKKEYEFKTIAIDIPSGLNGSTGEVMGICLDSDYTITFEFFKTGFLRYDIRDIIGKVFVEKIGIPYQIYNEMDFPAEFIDENYVLDNLIEKDSYANKGDYGKVAIYAGSKGFYGAAYLCAKSAMMSGSGLTTLASDRDTVEKLSIRLSEEMSCSLDEEERLKSIMDKADAVAFGPGTVNLKNKSEILEKILSYENIPVVIDAEGINILTENMIKDDSHIVLTPHMGEFSRLIGEPIDKINKNRLEYARIYAEKHGVVLVLKGENTIITDGIRTMVNTTGNNGMARGGMGDVLTGIITSLIGQGYDIFTASAIGVYIHGLCGDEIYRNCYTVNAEKLISIIPSIMKTLYDKLK